MSETKIDETFPLEQFLISGYAKLLRLDRNYRVGSIMLFIRDDIPFRLLKPGKLRSNTKTLFIEINLGKKEGLMSCGYNPKKSLINKLKYDISKVLDSFIRNYNKFLIVGELKSEITENSMHGSAIVIICTVYVINLPENLEKPS